MDDDLTSLDEALSDVLGEQAEGSFDHEAPPEGTPAGEDENEFGMPDEFPLFDSEDTQDDGEEERLAGLRQADYTRKTQQLAEERAALQAERESLQHAQAVWNALQEDPKGALEALIEQFSDVLDGEGPSQEAIRLERIEQRLEQEQNERYLNQLYAECASIAEEYGTQFDPDRLLEYAVEKEIPNLRAAFLLRREEVARAQKERQRQTAKETAPPVAGGSSRATGSSVTAPEEVNSFEDAFNAALSEIRS